LGIPIATAIVAKTDQPQDEETGKGDSKTK